ncbi:MAG: hypothetical protein PHE18_00965 [Candidatus Omnitrophica bacterium]|nr:hypothetical protein [Candidatus Omnitrophota bacterium]MDD5552433.1 hypothetical protein [Candidatus Omnitrophota bacterium]
MQKDNPVSYKKIQLPFKVRKPVLALGTQAKNTVCFAQGGFAYLSRIHRDLSDPEDFLSFERCVKYFLKKNPEIIAHDLHPEYQSTKYAFSLSPAARRLLPVQHHHAHIASCMAENGLRNERVIGVAFDGTGLGSDNHLWGGEFLVCDYRNFTRAAHLAQIPLLGAEKAILEPARLAAAWLFLLYKDKFPSMGINAVKKITPGKWRVLKRMYLSGFNSPSSASMGRLFDAAGSLVLGKAEAAFEAELAIGLEKLAARHQGAGPRGYRFKIIKEKNSYILDPAPMFADIVRDLRKKEPKEKIAFRFHRTIAQMILKASVVLRKENRVNKVVLSGGVFQNKLLLTAALDLLFKEGFKVFTHNVLSCNDSSVSLGQAAIAS